MTGKTTPAEHCGDTQIHSSHKAMRGGVVFRCPGSKAQRMLDVQGRCPACGWGSLFLGDGGYVTCSRIDCPEPDAASTLLERMAAPNPAVPAKDCCGSRIGHYPGCEDNQPEAQFGSTDCTCIPWTRQDGAPRYCGPHDTVDMIGGWERRRDCPHHAPAPVPVAHATPAHPGPCGQHCNHEAPVAEPDDTDLTEADIDRMMADGVPVQIVNGPPPTYAATAPAAEPGLRERLAEDIECALLPVMPRQDHRKQAANHAADAVLAVRDAELEQLRTERDASDDAARRLLAQRQEMAAERYVWQERGDKAEAVVERVRAECDRIEAAVRANPQDPDFDGAYLAAIGHIRRALNPQGQP